MEPGQAYLGHLDHTAGMLACRVEGDHLVVDRLQPPEVRGRWAAADREQPLFRRLADLAEMTRSDEVTLRSDWRERALEFANLYAPPVSHRRLAPGRRIPLRRFAEEALLLQWTLQLRAAVETGTSAARRKAVSAAMQIRALVPEVPEDTFAVHPRASATPEEEGDADGVPAALPPEEVARRLKLWSSRHGQDELWSLATNVLTSLLNFRLAGIAPVCLPGATRSGRPRLGLGLRFASPLARIWYGLWEEIAGVRMLACERCGRPFFAARAAQRFCSKNCQLAAGVERHRARSRRIEE